jgi:hypothetical protein
MRALFGSGALLGCRLWKMLCLSEDLQRGAYFITAQNAAGRASISIARQGLGSALEAAATSSPPE